MYSCTFWWYEEFFVEVHTLIISEECLYCRWKQFPAVIGFITPVSF